MAKNKLITSGGLINQPPGGNSIILTQASRWHKDIGDFRRAVTEAERVDYPSRVKLYDLYEMALLDTHLTAVLQKRKAAVLKLKVEFTCNEKPDEKVAELIDSPWFGKFLSDLIDTYWWGFSLFQFYSDKKGWMSYEMVPRKHVDPIRELIMKRQTDIEGTPWAEYPDLLAVGNRRDLGELVKVLPLVLYKHGTMADWAQYAEIFGQPIREYVYPAQDDAERRRILADDFEDTGGSSVIIRSDMSSLNLIEPKNQGGSNDLYKAFVGLCNAEISKLVLGNTLSTEASERGTQSLGQIQVEGEQSIIEADKVRLLNILNWEMAELFNVFGYDTQSGRFSFVTPREIDLNTRIQIDMQIANKGVPIADDYFYETYGIPKPENYDQLKQPGKGEPEPAPDPVRSEPPRKKKSDPTPNKTDPDPGKDAKKTKAKGFRRFFLMRPRYPKGGIDPGYPLPAVDDGSDESFSFDKSFFEDLARNIWGNDLDFRNEIDRAAWAAFLDTFNKAVDKGFGVPPANESLHLLYEELKHNNGVFSAFRTHALQKEIAGQLLDADGKLKSFEQFRKDIAQFVEPRWLDSWLRTEYDTAVLRAQQARQWIEFEKHSDVLPNLKWMPTTSVHIGEDHHPFWFPVSVVKPINDPFWQQHRPGDRWNCKCSLQATDEPATGIPDSGENEEPSPGLDNNPALDGKIFGDRHPYQSEAGRHAKSVVKKFIEKQED